MPYASPTLTSTYEGLCVSIADTLNRADLTTGIPNFVALATARIQRDMARLRHPSSLSRATASLTSNYAPLPADYLSMYQLMDQNNSIVIEYISPEQSKQVLASGTGVPYTIVGGGTYYFTILGKTLRLIPPPSATAPDALDLWYYAKVPEINATSTTNWVLSKYPDLYLYGALVHSAPYLKADERIAIWDSAYQRIIQDIEVEADRATRPQSKLVAARKSF